MSSSASALKPSASNMEQVRRILDRDGFEFVTAADMPGLLSQSGDAEDWQEFASSWDDLATDTYMKDGGRYRRRRFGVFSVERDGAIKREPHQPHFQSLDHNTLNGGIDRWFEPVTEAAGRSASLRAVLSFCRDCFCPLAPEVASWHVEMHQFRIEARSGELGKPTPEGMHRDGVDYVLVLLVKRTNIASGNTTIADFEGRSLGSFTLTDPFDAALVDDTRVMHGVTPIQPDDPALPAYRDVLVITFKRKLA